MRLIDTDALPEMEMERFDTTDAFEIKLKGAGRNQMRKIIEEAPTIDAVPVRHAEWRPHPIKGCEEWDVCSACGIGTHRRLVSDLGEEEYSYSYCPWCGAKMDGEQ